MKRFDLEFVDPYGFREGMVLNESEDGDYVLFDDVEKEIERLRRVEEQHERLKKAAKELIKDFSGNAILSAMVWDIEIALEKK